jgi:urea carboxylase
MIAVMKPGLETSVQDFPGRLGYWEQGFPPSGPMDPWSFRLANLLVGNEPGAAGLECQFVGPSLRFEADTVFAVTGADMGPTIDGEPVTLWQSHRAKPGQVLALGAAVRGARAYLAFAGAIDCPAVLGSRSTFHQAGIGGIEGYALKAGQRIRLGEGAGIAGRRIRPQCRPEIDGRRQWQIEAVPGPNDDWIDAAGHRSFLAADWRLQAKSNRTGFRLSGPELSFTERARNKRPEHGQDPSNILDHGYPFGAVNLCGQTPIILVNDGPSTGGFINPYTVATAAFWKLAQSRPGDSYRFVSVDVARAQALRREIDSLCAPDSLE